MTQAVIHGIETKIQKAIQEILKAEVPNEIKRRGCTYEFDVKCELRWGPSQANGK